MSAAKIGVKIVFFRSYYYYLCYCVSIFKDVITEDNRMFSLSVSLFFSHVLCLLNQLSLLLKSQFSKLLKVDV